MGSKGSKAKKGGKYPDRRHDEYDPRGRYPPPRNERDCYEQPPILIPSNDICDPCPPAPCNPCNQRPRRIRMQPPPYYVDIPPPPPKRVRVCQDIVLC